MRSRAVLREAWRNIATGASRARGLAIAAVIAAVLAAGAEVVSIQQLLERAREYRLSGASISIVTAEGSVDGDRCDRLSEVPGVRASGAVRTSAQLFTPIVLPSAPIPVSHASPGFIALLGTQAHGVGVLLGSEAAEALGANKRGSIATHSGTLQVAGTYAYPDDGRRPGFSYAAIAPTNAATPYDECWVDIWPEMNMNAAMLSTIAVTGSNSPQPAISQLNSSLGKSFDGNARFEERITRFAGACAALGGLVLGFFGVRARRLSLASALHAGVPRRSLLAMVSLETLAWVAVSATFVVPITIVMSTAFSGGVASATLVPGLCAAAPLWLGAFAGTWLGIATVSEQYLFDYFKMR